jgi:hypothetical protein
VVCVSGGGLLFVGVGGGEAEWFVVTGAVVERRRGELFAVGWVVVGVLVAGIRKIAGAVGGLVAVPGSLVTWMSVGVGGMGEAGLELNLDECIVAWEPGLVFRRTD